MQAAVYLVGAVIAGQCGAAWLASRILRGDQLEIAPTDSANNQYSLRQLLGLTTVVAMLLVVVPLLNMFITSYLAILLCAAWQAATILLFQRVAHSDQLYAEEREDAG